MQFKVSLHISQLTNLEKMVTILDRQELLVDGFCTFYVEANMTPEEFWEQWHSLDI